MIEIIFINEGCGIFLGYCNLLNRTLTITEKTVSTLLIIWGALLLYLSIEALRMALSFGFIQKDSIFNLLVVYHILVLIPVITVAGGTFLLFGKKLGWVVSLIASLLNAVNFLIPTEKGKSMFKNTQLLLTVVWLTIFSLLTFYILTLPAFRIKYKANSKNWWVIIITVLIIVIDKSISYLMS